MIVNPKDAPGFRISERKHIKGDSVKGLAVVGVAVLVAGTASLSLLSGFFGNTKKEVVQSKPLDQPPIASMLSSLPKEYIRSSKPEPLKQVLQAESKPVVKAESNTEDEFERLRKEYRLKRAKAAYSAQESDITFSGALTGSEKKTSTRESNDEPMLPSLGALQGLTAGAGAISQMPPGDGGDRDKANRQDDKLEFLNQSSDEDPYISKRVIGVRSPKEVKAGTVIPGLLLSGINSDLPGNIVGQVSRNIFDTVTGNHLLIPQGTRVMGKYDSRIVYGQERVLVVWSRLIFPDGRSLQIENMAGTDSAGYAGLTGDVNNHYGKLIAGVVLTSLLGAAAQIADGRNYQTTDPRYDTLALQGMAEELNNVGQEITRRNLDVQPTIEIRPGERFSILVHKDMVIE